MSGKYSKIIVYCILSWILYYLINYNESTISFINKVTLIFEKSPNTRIRLDFLFFLVLGLFNYFLLLFGIVSLIFLIIKFFYKK